MKDDNRRFTNRSSRGQDFPSRSVSCQFHLESPSYSTRSLYDNEPEIRTKKFSLNLPRMQGNSDVVIPDPLCRSVSAQVNNEIV